MYYFMNDLSLEGLYVKIGAILGTYYPKKWLCTDIKTSFVFIKNFDIKTKPLLFQYSYNHTIM